MKVTAITDRGSIRALNEDSFCLPPEGERWCCVADGMGGHLAGDIASDMAVRVFSEGMSGHTDDTAECLLEVFRRANERIFRAQMDDPSRAGMGTTMTALALDGGEALIAHVGDSRAYLFRKKKLSQITTDHSYVEELVRQGLITRSAARFHPDRNVILRALGTDETVEADLYRVALEKGDVFLLCTDGLSGYVEDKKIAEVLSSRKQAESKAKTLRDLALAAGGGDNITVLLVSVGEEFA